MGFHVWSDERGVEILRYCDNCYNAHRPLQRSDEHDLCERCKAEIAGAVRQASLIWVELSNWGWEGPECEMCSGSPDGVLVSVSSQVGEPYCLCCVRRNQELDPAAYQAWLFYRQKRFNIKPEGILVLV